eukprot:6977-Heterococcus_DN1.PRE.3
MGTHTGHSTVTRNPKSVAYRSQPAHGAAITHCYTSCCASVLHALHHMVSSRMHYQHSTTLPGTTTTAAVTTAGTAAAAKKHSAQSRDDTRVS